MRIETSITLLPQYPSETSWAALRRVAEDWNLSHAYPISEIAGIMLQLRILDSTQAETAEVVSLLKQIHSEVSVSVYAASRRIYDGEDYRDAAFVELNGASLDRVGQSLVVNGDEALGYPVRCLSCGWQDQFNAPQNAPFVIDESLLDDAPPGCKWPQGGWDFIALPAGRQLISERLLLTLRKGNVSGIDVLPVFAATTGRESSRVFQLAACRAVLTPCSIHHSDVTYCASCGAVVDSPERNGAGDFSLTPQAEYAVSREQVAGNDVLSRHPSRGAMLYFSQRVYRMLVDTYFNGVTPSELMRFCRHS